MQTAAIMSSLIIFIILATIIGIFIYLFKVIKRAEQRAEERLRIEKEKNATQKQQIQMLNQINSRVKTIESYLETVE